MSTCAGMLRRCSGKTNRQLLVTLLVRPLSIAKTFTSKVSSVPGSTERTWALYESLWPPITSDTQTNVPGSGNEFRGISS